MKEVMINGVTYLPASVLAKEFKYTTDYIGQLCRAKKVDAQLIGRSWYVNPLSLTAHKQAKVAKSANNKAEVRNVKASEAKVSRLVVLPVVTKSAARVSGFTDQGIAKRMDWEPLRYEVDEVELLPVMARTVAPTKLAVNLADSHVVTIKTSVKSPNAITEELSDVPRTGSVKITSLSDELDTIEEQLVGETTFSPVEIKKINFAPLRKQEQSKSKIITVSGDVVDPPKLVKPNFVAPTPAPVLEEEVVVVVSSHHHTLEVFLTALCALLVACLALLVFAESIVEATAGSYRFDINFSVASFSALVSYFSY